MSVATPFVLRAVEMRDAELLFEWRNDPETYQHFRNARPVEWGEHTAWLQKSLDMGSKRILQIVEVESHSAGVIRADVQDDGSYEISYTIAPEWRGKGIGKKAVIQFAKEHLHDTSIIATVEKGHHASESLARSLGLSPREELPRAENGRSFVVWR